MNNKDINKPNKNTEIIGYILLIIGLLAIIVRIFILKETFLTIIGIVLFLVGTMGISVGKYGYQQTVEMTNQYEISKAKAIAKGVKDSLKDEDNKK